MSARTGKTALASIAAGFALTALALALKALFPGERTEIAVSPGESFSVGGERMTLLAFDMPKYPSGRPRQYISRLLALDLAKGEGEGIETRVNHPARRNGTWIYQHSFEGEKTVLVFFKDPWLPLAAAGGALLLLGAFLFALPGSCAADMSRFGRPGAVGLAVRVFAAAAALYVPMKIIVRACLRAEPPPALQSWLFAPHVASYAASYIILLFAAVGIGRKAVPLGFFLMTLGLVSGAVWGKICWGDFWQYDPKEMWSLATWLVYAAYAFLSGRPRFEAWLRRFGGVMIILLSTWANFSRLFKGLHSM